MLKQVTYLKHCKSVLYISEGFMKLKRLKGSGSLILLRLKIGLAPQKHCVISMPRQQYTTTKHILIERYHPVVSIMLR